MKNSAGSNAVQENTTNKTVTHFLLASSGLVFIFSGIATLMLSMNYGL